MALTLNVAVHSVDIEEGETSVKAPGTEVATKQRTAVLSVKFRSQQPPHVELEVTHVDPAALGATVTENAAKHLVYSGIAKGDAFTITVASSAPAAPATPAQPAAPAQPATAAAPVAQPAAPA